LVVESGADTLTAVAMPSCAIFQDGTMTSENVSAESSALAVVSGFVWCVCASEMGSFYLAVLQTVLRSIFNCTGNYVLQVTATLIADSALGKIRELVMTLTGVQGRAPAVLTLGLSRTTLLALVSNYLNDASAIDRLKVQ